MKILNLVDESKSDIKYKVSKFPDGQQQVTLNIKEFLEDRDYEFGEEQLRTDVTIKSRLNSFLDLELVICSVKALRNTYVTNIHLYVPYFLGSRSDRQFEEGSNNYLKDVICPIINSLNFKSVTVLDPHSHVLEACLNNFKKIDNESLVRFALQNINKQSGKDWNKLRDLPLILVSPDSGASHKIYKLAEQIGYTGDIITCSKERDKDGKLSKCVVPMKPEYTTKDLIIIDDLIDAGNTFINIAKSIDDYNKNYKSIYGGKYLVVTHGIFSNGFSELYKCFDGIYCTNSYSDMKDFSKAQLCLDNGVEGAYKTGFVKQLNIF